MKRYQEIEIERHCKNTKSFLKHLQAKHPQLFEIWGEEIEFNLNQGMRPPSKNRHKKASKNEMNRSISLIY